MLLTICKNIGGHHYIKTSLIPAYAEYSVIIWMSETMLGCLSSSVTVIPAMWKITLKTKLRIHIFEISNSFSCWPRYAFPSRVDVHVHESQLTNQIVKISKQRSCNPKITVDLLRLYYHICYVTGDQLIPMALPAN